LHVSIALGILRQGTALVWGPRALNQSI
jgi:hypothetical protein